MNLSDYFDNTKGYGVLATADSAGKGQCSGVCQTSFLRREHHRIHHAGTADACESPDQPSCNLPVHTVRTGIRRQEALPDQAS